MPPSDSRRTKQYIPQRTYLRPSALSARSSARLDSSKAAAAGVVRDQIENIYQQNVNATAHAEVDKSKQEEQINQIMQARSARAEAFAQTSHTNPDSPYDRSHVDDRTEIPENQWKHYHSSWQNYYQQYYERYYLGEVYRMQQTVGAQPATTASQTAPDESAEKQTENNDVVHDLRSDLLQNVRESAVKVRKSHHFMPFAAAALTMVLFLFLQYNRILFSNVEAYVSPGNINPANIIVDPNISIPISNEPRLIIPKINVDVPVVYDTKPDPNSQLRAMEGGVAWFGIPGANSRPGQVGNTVLSGHSSNDLFDPGDYKFIFARLDQLVLGDTFYVNYLGTRYTYSITQKEVVKPTDVQKLIYPTDKPVMTLITCVPLGTAQNRLLVTAEQVSPNPSEAKEAPSQSEPTDKAAMPGNSPSFIDRLFGAN